MNIRGFTLALLLTAGLSLQAQVRRTTIPEWLVPLREAIYEQQLSADAVRPLYSAAKTAAQTHLSGAALDVALSRCEYFMGRALHYEKREKEANVHYHEGIRLAQRALQTAPSAEAWAMRAENLSQTCSIGPWTYTVANGLDVEKFAKNALALNSRNAAAQYMVAARWVFAPAPFSNIRRGIEMMEAILVNGDTDKDDLFNIYSAIGYGYIQQKKITDARPWLLKSLEIYPTNKFAAELLAKK
jgi:tetratricopeptide (TPR) repeat protein